MAPRCSHAAVSYASSAHAVQVQYQQPALAERLAATKPEPSSKLDDLAVDPDSPQDHQKWHGIRNQITSRRKTIYVAEPPPTPTGMDLNSWTQPVQLGIEEQVPKPKTQDIIEYLEAFYHGLPVRELQFQCYGLGPWSGNKPKSDDRQLIGLSTQKQCVRIRARPFPDAVYSYQLNLSDLLDAAVAMLPSDAYALCLLVDHDLFEDGDDDFVCGRAYGGKRVALNLLSAQLDPLQGHLPLLANCTFSKVNVLAFSRSFQSHNHCLNNGY
ncbi:hypothetical protein BDW62DRAFT_198078 [Aspergillus aurantiobrunneus]